MIRPTGQDVLSFPDDPHRHHRAEAFEAIAATLPLGTVSFERHPADHGQRLVWLEPHVLNKLRALRRPGESYSDVILRLVESEAM